jgi:hypothetical protein
MMRTWTDEYQAIWVQNVLNFVKEYKGTVKKDFYKELTDKHGDTNPNKEWRFNAT